MQSIQPSQGIEAYLFSPHTLPAARVSPGEAIELYTADAFAGKLTANGDVPSRTIVKYGNPQTGPVYIEGAEPGDVLKVDILSIEPTRDWAVSAHLLHGGGLEAAADRYLLHRDIPERTFIYKFDGENYRYNERLYFPWAPFLGTVATAPEIESIASQNTFSGGGNMDCPVTKPGNSLYLPVRVPGALFYAGDCHAGQGHGEACAVALEIAAKVTLRFSVLKNKTIACPRVESESELICIGMAKSMEEAARLSYCQLIGWMTGEYGWDTFEAYQAISQAGKMYVGSMVSSTSYCMVGSIEKKVVLRARQAGWTGTQGEVREK